MRKCSLVGLAGVFAGLLVGLSGQTTSAAGGRKHLDPATIADSGEVITVLIPLIDSDPAQAAEVYGTLFPAGALEADKAAGGLKVTGPSSMVRVLAGFIANFDQPGLSVRVFRKKLEHGQVSNIVPALNQIFGNQRGIGGTLRGTTGRAGTTGGGALAGTAMFAVDPTQPNTLVAATDATYWEMIKGIIDELDRAPVATATASAPASAAN